MLFCASSSPAAELFWMSCSCICAPTPRASSCTVAVVSYFCRFSRILRTTALPPMAIYIKSSQAASPSAPDHLQLQTTKLRPFLVPTGLYLAASLPPGKTIHVRPFYPNVLTHINLERTRVQGWEVGEEWSRFGCCLIVVSRSPGRPFTTSFSSIMFWNTTTWHVRTTTTGNGCIAYAAARHIVRADTS